MGNEQKLREFSEWLDTYRDLPVHEVFHEIVLRYEEAIATTEPEPTGMPELPEPDSYEFQHEETGNTMFVDRQQVEWGFEKNNPRLQKIAGACTTSQMRTYGEQCWKAGYKHGKSGTNN